MVPNLHPLNALFELDDPYPATSANMLPIQSRRFQRWWEVTHRADGTHLPPVAQGAAIVEWDTVSYNLLTNTALISSVSRITTGQVTVTLADAMVEAEKWIAVGIPDVSAESDIVGCVELYTSKTTTTSVLHFYDSSGTAKDTNFLLLVYGDLA